MYVCTSVFCSYIDAAEILEPIGNETKYFTEEVNVTLICIGVGHPPPLVQWRKLDGLLSDRVSTTNVSMLTNKGNVTRVTVQLILTRVLREDAGVYECLVSNHLNSIARSINVIVQCMYTYVVAINNYFTHLFCSHSNYHTFG